MQENLNYFVIPENNDVLRNDETVPKECRSQCLDLMGTLIGCFIEEGIFFQESILSKESLWKTWHL